MRFSGSVQVPAGQNNARRRLPSAFPALPRAIRGSPGEADGGQKLNCRRNNSRLAGARDLCASDSDRIVTRGSPSLGANSRLMHRSKTYRHRYRATGPLAFFQASMPRSM
jgi:hypothetical protein